jgi:hypothetical protein
MCWSVTPTGGCSRACSPVSTRRRRPASCWSTPRERRDTAPAGDLAQVAGPGGSSRRVRARATCRPRLRRSARQPRTKPGRHPAGSPWATEVNPPGRRGSPEPSVATSSGHQQRERAPDQRSAGDSRCRCRARAVRAFWMHAGVSAAAEQTPARDDEQARRPRLLLLDKDSPLRCQHDPQDSPGGRTCDHWLLPAMRAITHVVGKLTLSSSRRAIRPRVPPWKAEASRRSYPRFATPAGPAPCFWRIRHSAPPSDFDLLRWLGRFFASYARQPLFPGRA